MVRYLKAENLKLKHTFTRKFILIAPLATLLVTRSLAAIWFQINALNWWYILLMPGYIALLSALADQKESKKLNYRGVLALPVSLRKLWVAKIMNLILYVALSCLILLIGVLLGSPFVPNPLAPGSVCFGIFFIFITTLWQIPFCLFLFRKIGMVGTIIIQVGAGLLLGVFFATKANWWLCPYSWTMRIMTPVLGILPNGTLAQAGDPMLNPASIPIGIALPVILFVVLLIATAIWFQRQEAK